MAQIANFSVAPRLAAILGENYTSSEHAELADNAWDAEVKVVQITLPEILSDVLIIVTDDGSGMKERALRQEYLNFANPRFSRKVEKSRSLRTWWVISKNALLSAAKDIEQGPSPIEIPSFSKSIAGRTRFLSYRAVVANAWTQLE